jgi:hypothetical protein
MKLVEMNWDPNEQQLQQFGVFALVALPSLGWLWGASPTALTVLLGFGVVLAALGMFAPRTLKYVFVGLSVVTIPIGLVVSEIALMLTFALVFFPIGVLFRLSRRDSLRLKPIPVESHWVEKPQPRSVSSYYRQW